MIEIKLTQSQVTLIDECNYEKVKNINWFAHKHRNGMYYAMGNITIDSKRKTIYMHRVLMDAKKGELIDHKDRNSLNNCLSNLRIATRSENSKNKKGYGASSYLGVSWKKGLNKWTAKICNNQKQIHLGSFINEIDAAKAYNKAAIEYHGEFANLNKFIEL